MKAEYYSWKNVELISIYIHESIVKMTLGEHFNRKFSIFSSQNIIMIRNIEQKREKQTWKRRKGSKTILEAVCCGKTNKRDVNIKRLAGRENEVGYFVFIQLTMHEKHISWQHSINENIYVFYGTKYCCVLC